MSRSLARTLCFIGTAFLAALGANPNGMPALPQMAVVFVAAFIVGYCASHGWRDVAPATFDDSPLPPDVLDLGDKSKVGRS